MGLILKGLVQTQPPQFGQNQSSIFFVDTFLMEYEVPWELERETCLVGR